MQVRMVNDELRIIPGNDEEREDIKNLCKFFENINTSKAILQVKGMKAKPGTPETDSDPRNPNL